MMDEAKILWILDFMADKAKEFVQVSDEVMEGERSLQAHDGELPSDWQACSTISAFINYVAETERFRYGHFACDLERKNNEHKMREASSVLRRMALFWDHDETDEGLTDEQRQKRQDVIDGFVANDFEIKAHLAKQPNMYQDGVPQEAHRDWSIRLRILGEKEASLLKRWQRLIAAEKQPQTPQTSSPPETPQP